MTLPLQAQRILVTGSTQGVGLAIARTLVTRGAKVVLHGLRDDEVAQRALATCREAGGDVEFFAADLAQDHPRCVETLIQQVWDTGPLDGLVCNAGTYIDQPFLDMDFERFDRTLKLNVYAYYGLAQACARRWVASGHPGRMVFVGSINGRLAEDVHVAYDTSKGAVEMLVKSLAVSLGRHGIRVNGMAPGLIHTPLTAPALDDPRFERWMEWHTPNGRVPGPEVCGGPVAFLLSDDATHVHGHMLMVDGGMSGWQQPDPPKTPL